MPLGYLSQLVATMPEWIALAINQDELDLNPPGGKRYQPEPTETLPALLAAHDHAVAKGLAAIKGTTEAHLGTSWKLLSGGHVVLEQPRSIVIADTFTHLAHHRGQLTVYLRLNSVPVPSVYGPTADERPF
jgi:uncharacterized damage-inducible protein DinB